jgi:hypothetical protein
VKRVAAVLAGLVVMALASITLGICKAAADSDRAMGEWSW